MKRLNTRLSLLSSFSLSLIIYTCTHTHHIYMYIQLIYFTCLESSFQNHRQVPQPSVSDVCPKANTFDFHFTAFVPLLQMVSVGLALTFKLHWPWVMDKDLLWPSEPRLKCRCQTHCEFCIPSCLQLKAELFVEILWNIVIMIYSSGHEQEPSILKQLSRSRSSRTMMIWLQGCVWWHTEHLGMRIPLGR